MASENKIDWFRSPVPREVLLELTKRRDLLPLVHVLLRLAISVGTGIAVYAAWEYSKWYVWVPVLYVHCLMFAFLSTSGAVHELSHRTVFRSRWLNEVFLALFSFLSWTNPVFFRASHMRHHKYTVHRDYDMEVVLPEIIAKTDWWFYATIALASVPHVPGFFSTLWVSVRRSFGIVKGEWEETLFPKENRKGRARLFWWGRILLVGHLGIAAVSIVTGNWIMILLITFGRVIAPGLAALCSLTQHIGLVPDVPDFRLSCRTVILGPFLRFLYWSMNYHVEHHMFAAVPYYNLPALRKTIEADVPTAERGLVRNWKGILEVVRRQRNNPEYVFTPDLP